MRTFEFSRHNVLIATEDSSSLEIPDAMKCRANYTVLRARGETRVRINWVERETKPGIWLNDWLPSLERQKLEEHIEKMLEEDEALDLHNVREVARGFA